MGSDGLLLDLSFKTGADVDITRSIANFDFQLLEELAHFSVELLNLLHFLKDVDKFLIDEQKFLLQQLVLRCLGHGANLSQESVKVCRLINKVSILSDMLRLENSI